jgi:pimeloyl-ACP methyl ester carboxylesterase
LGHDATAPDLPGHGRRRDERASLEGYRQAVVDVLEPGDILVGHSMGAGVVALAADAFSDLRHLVLLAGPLPVEGRPLHWLSRAEEPPGRRFPDEFLRPTEDGESVYIADFEAAWTYFYHDCLADVAKWAFEHLTPQQVSVMMRDPVSIPNFWAADLPRSYVRCQQDRAFPSWYSDMQIQRLGVEPLEIDSSHSPFLSRPTELAQLLVHAVSTQPVAPLQPNIK